MMKKVLAMIFALALVLSLLPMAAMQASAASDDVDYRVGYAKVDINPYWSHWKAAGNDIPSTAKTSTGENVTADHVMPLPMGGYGGNAHRLSRPELIDDNGSGEHAEGVVYLSSNRYTQDFAKEMLGDGTDAYNAYAEGGFGQNDGDGIYATCVAIRQNPDAEPVLMFSVDLIGVGETYVGQAKNVIIRELKKQGISVSPERILINATHTHGAVALGESFESEETYTQKLYGNESTVDFTGAQMSSYLNFYRKLLYSQLADAAVKALADGQQSGKVVMEKGTLDVSDATGYQLNGVRHRKARLTTTVDGVEQTVDYVTGSSFNVDLKGEKEISGVSESDDRLHVLQFSFPEGSNVEPILLINWRAHTTANNKMNSKAYNNLSADFVAAMRYQLEQWGYRPMLNYSASGNLGMGNTPSTYDISTSATETTMNATKYGYKLAFAAMLLARGGQDSLAKEACQDNLESIQTLIDTARKNATNAQTAAETAEAAAATAQTNADNCKFWEYSKKQGYLAQRDEQLAIMETQLAKQASYTASADAWETKYAEMEAYYNDLASGEETLGTTVCTQGKILLETTWYSVTPQTSTEAQYQAALYHDALAVDEGGSETNAGGLKLEKTGYPFVIKASDEPYEANGESFTITENVVIASQYHANSLENRYGTVNDKRISLCAFTLGDQVAFVTVPFEASDRYSEDAKLDTANDYNNWNDLVGSKWGTPFVMSLTNGSEGYVPNNLAYTYTKDLEEKTIAGTIGQNFVSGSYEAHTAYAAAGEGEKIVAELNTLLRNLGSAAAPATKTGYCQACKETVTWTALDDKVVEDNSMSLTSGHYYLAKDYTTTFGQAMVYLNETVCLDLNGHTYYASTNTGVSRVFSLYGTLNIQNSVGNGVMQGKMAGGGNGGTVIVNGLGCLNLYSGTLTCDTSGTGTVAQGGVVFVGDNGVFNMYGGTITGGKASSFGGNVSAQHKGDSSTVGGTFNMYGGTITGGTVTGTTTSSANLMVSGKSFFRFNGGSIDGAAFMQGTMYLGSHTPQTVDTAHTAEVAVRNSATVTLDGVFTGKINLDYSNTKNESYSTAPAQGATLGAVTSGSWIDHVNGAQITASGKNVAATGDGIVSGNALVLGTAPEAGYCHVCGKNVHWVTLEDKVFFGHYVLDESLTDMAEKTVQAGSLLCLDLNGNTYTAAKRAFTVHGTLNVQDTGSGGVLRGTAVNGKNGGTVYVNDGGTLKLAGGTVTCVPVDNAAISKGGVVYVAAGGEATVAGAAVSGGTATNGGNVYVSADASLTLADGSITGGTTTGNGGNVYTEGAFTMTGGSVTGGTANYGGNIQVQYATASFTMAGGTVSGGTGKGSTATANVCTSTNSHFRMEGGYIAGSGAYIQGLATLTGSTDGQMVMKVKQSAQRLTIEGTYTGMITLSDPDNTYAVGSVVAKLSNANIGDATITLASMPEFGYLAAEGNTLVLRQHPILAAVGDVNYIDLAEAIKAYNKAEAGWLTVKTDDLAISGLTRDLYLDLNGCTVASVDTGNHTLTVKDSATDDYLGETYGSIPAGTAYTAQANYLAVTEEGRVSFHKYALDINFVTLKTTKAGLNYKCYIAGDQKVKEQVSEFGIAMNVYKASTEQDIFLDSQNKTHVWRSGSLWQTGKAGQELNGVGVIYIMKTTGYTNDGNTLTDAENQNRAEIPVFGRAYMVLKDGTYILGDPESRTLREVTEEVDQKSYSALEDKSYLHSLYQAFENVMSSWDIPNLIEGVAGSDAQ